MAISRPRPSREFRSELDACAAVLISSPEYAHGVPGALKNALDWIVGSGELVGKPVALVNVSPRSTYAQASLAETLRVMSADLVDAASMAVPLGGRHLDASGIVADTELSSDHPFGARRACSRGEHPAADCYRPDHRRHQPVDVRIPWKYFPLLRTSRFRTA